MVKPAHRSESSTSRSREEAFAQELVKTNFQRLPVLLIGLIAVNGIQAFIGHELGPFANFLPRTGHIVELLISPFLLVLFWFFRTRPTNERSFFLLLAVAVESLACGWYFYLALPVLGPTAVYALTIIAFGVFLLIPPKVFFLLILPGTLLHLGLAFLSDVPPAVKTLVFLHGVAAMILALVAQTLLYRARRREFFEDGELFEKTEHLSRENRLLSQRCQELQASTALAAHDLQGPLQSLVAVLRLASERKEWRAEPHASLLREATQTCVGLLDLGGRMLNDYRASHEKSTAEGNSPLGTAVHDLAALCKEVASDFQGNIQKKELTLSWRMPEHPALVRVDPPTVRGALANLLDNAVKYSRLGGRIEMHLHGEETFWVLDIRDSGPGIPEKERQRIFQQFYQGGNRPAEAPPGNGLGLWIARQRIEASGGHVDLAESGADGSVFRVRLPMASQE